MHNTHLQDGMPSIPYKRKIEKTIEGSMRQCEIMPTEKCAFKELLDVRRHRGFFSAPCLHFPSNARFVDAGMAAGAAVMALDDDGYSDDECSRDGAEVMFPPCGGDGGPDGVEEAAAAAVHRGLYGRLGYPGAATTSKADDRRACVSSEIGQCNGAFAPPAQAQRKWRPITRGLFELPLGRCEVTSMAMWPFWRMQVGGACGMGAPTERAGEMGLVQRRPPPLPIRQPRCIGRGWPCRCFALAVGFCWRPHRAWRRCGHNGADLSAYLARYAHLHGIATTETRQHWGV